MSKHDDRKRGRWFVGMPSHDPEFVYVRTMRTSRATYRVVPREEWEAGQARLKERKAVWEGVAQQVGYPGVLREYEGENQACRFEAWEWNILDEGVGPQPVLAFVSTLGHRLEAFEVYSGGEEVLLYFGAEDGHDTPVRVALSGFGEAWDAETRRDRSLPIRDADLVLYGEWGGVAVAHPFQEVLGRRLERVLQFPNGAWGVGFEGGVYLGAALGEERATRRYCVLERRAVWR